MNVPPILELPPLSTGGEPPRLPGFRQLTLIGGMGSGKTRFMHALIAGAGERAFVLSAMDAFYPERTPSALAGSIDTLYADAIAKTPYLKGEAVSEFDKLMFLLFNDECTYLLEHKSRMLFGDDPGPLRPTRLDRLIGLWQRIFPENQILRHSGRLMFSTSAGSDTVSAVKLSQGEKAALYYIASVLYAIPGAYIFIDSPTRFLHPAILNSFWNSIEQLRPDCRFVYSTYDVEFVRARTDGVCVWVKGYDAESRAWDYQVLSPAHLSDELMLTLVGGRRPVIFIEGDAEHSIDARLYPLIFSDYTVRPLGSCDKVIEATRTFGDLQALHHLESMGIVDRDRRTAREVDYLRKKHILVPEVAEVENLFLLENVIKTMAHVRGRNPERLFLKVKDNIMKMWASHRDSQALMHTRHRVKRLAECRIDGRFGSLSELERHIAELPRILDPGGIYREIDAEFRAMQAEDDYAGVLRVFNHKPMLASCGVDSMLGFRSHDAYIAGTLSVLKEGGEAASRLRAAFLHAFGIDRRIPKSPDKEAKPARRNKKHR